MATYTTNINLKKPAQNDKIRIADFNGNADNIDAAFGAGFGQSSKPSVDASINNLADGLAIVAQGNVHAAISAGQFVYVRGHGTLGEGLYVANQAISANGTLSSSNLDADTSGGLNALNSNKASKTELNAYIFNKTYSVTTSGTGAVSLETADKPHRFVGALLTSGGPGFVFRRDENYFTAFDNSMQPLANTSITFIAYFAQYIS